MASVVDYVRDEHQKDLISNALTRFFLSDPDSDEHKQLVEEISEKIKFLNELKKNIIKEEGDMLQELADKFGTNIDKIATSFVHFFLITENAWLSKALEAVIDLKEN